MEKLKLAITRILMFFVIFSIGFSFGKYQRSGYEPKQNTQQDPKTDKSYFVRVYYMHSTFRCEECNQIEKMAKAVLDNNFSADMKAGRIRWKTVNFQQNGKLAEKFKVVSSCVVVEAIMPNGKTQFKRLDEVWTLFQNKVEFDKYILNAVQKMLTLGSEGGVK